MDLKPLEKVPVVGHAIRARRAVLDLLAIYRSTRPLHPRSCPVCSFEGHFRAFGTPPRLDARCPSCGALERHRLFWLLIQKEGLTLPQPIIHFAPEKALEGRLRSILPDYRTADLFANADLKLNLEAIELEANSVGTAICNHVLEHVNDAVALKELHRILAPGGRLLASVPIVEGWSRTYENPEIRDPHLRDVHFGQFDHVRFYGSDLRDRFRGAGFSDIKEVTAEGEDVVTYGLQRGEKIFVCTK